jgi:hypothetical protein
MTEQVASEPGTGETKRVFIVGCPRSGSTWTTFLMAQHPAVGTFQHAKVFDYLVQMRRWWRTKAGYSFIVEPPAPGEAPKPKEESLKLADVLPEAELHQLLRHVAAGIVDSVARVRPGVSVVVDKTPENGHLADFIQTVLPDAYFLHIVRDPRSVFCSHRSASTSWARWEFPTQPIDGAKFWRSEVETSLAIAGTTDRYLQVRYEDLKEKGASELARIFEWIGLEVEEGFCERAVQASTKDKVRKTQVLPKNFVRKTTPGGWRDELSDSHLRIIEHLAGELMERLGYERVGKPFRRTPLRIRLREAPEPLLAFVDKKLHRLTQLAHWRWVGRKLEWEDP